MYVTCSLLKNYITERRKTTLGPYAMLIISKTSCRVYCFGPVRPICIYTLLCMRPTITQQLIVTCRENHFRFHFLSLSTFSLFYFCFLFFFSHFFHEKIAKYTLVGRNVKLTLIVYFVIAVPASNMHR